MVPFSFFRRGVGCLSGALLIIGGVLAQGAATQTSHVHGVATLDVAVEGTLVYLAFSSPAVNLVGFEHAPDGDQERASVARARAALAEPQRLFAIAPEAGCRLAESRVEAPWPESHEAHPAPSDGAEQPPGGDATAGDVGHAADAHSDVSAEYRFLCEQPARISDVRVLLFRVFPLTERVQAQYIGPGGQGAVMLTPDSPLITF